MWMRGCWALFLIVGCSSSSPSPAASKACTPGAQVSCACAGGTPGAQACAADGSGYGACDCVAAVAGGDGSASSSGGTMQAEASLDGTTSQSEAEAATVCGPSNCAGCCWANMNYPPGTPLQCLGTGQGAGLCGNHGVACSSCLTQLDGPGSCQPAKSTDYSQGGVCVASPAPTCQSTCAGCCDSAGACHAVENSGTGQVLDFCGLSGAACYVCDCTPNAQGYFGDAGLRYLGDAGGPFANCRYSPGEMSCVCTALQN
jgi:hypothetical protein